MLAFPQVVEYWRLSLAKVIENVIVLSIFERIFWEEVKRKNLEKKLLEPPVAPEPPVADPCSRYTRVVIRVRAQANRACVPRHARTRTEHFRKF